MSLLVRSAVVIVFFHAGEEAKALMMGKVPIISKMQAKSLFYESRFIP
ncbi:hypothetical protein H0A71_10995 [Alcaligenaceae bacterium]|nr:hypothetical protein [Alcaligenaceae bacterium]